MLGLLGCCGLLRSHRRDGAAIESDPLARYPAAREPATPNADAAHTPLMTPAITPEMLGRPALPRPEEVPESGRMAGEIPAPRPQAGEAGTGVPAGVSAAVRGGVRPVGRGVAEGPVSPGRDSGLPRAAAEQKVAGLPAVPEGRPRPVEVAAPPARVPVIPQGSPQPAAERASAAPRAVQPVAGPAPEPSPLAAQEHPAEERVPQQPKHALRAEAPEAQPEPESPAKQGSFRRRNPVGTVVGKVKRLLRRH
ncbi:hypothetical protein [Amycolatopsis sp. MtRt-6]|uniref:hypothetical protein n=1 Tax=Amycolatopsis sp. MtRt-6 TaxID=2792782 RepID=UPI001A8DD416|nr:hypothetical protein [Amycolatopsis sp. MtRt-6]